MVQDTGESIDKGTGMDPAEGPDQGTCQERILKYLEDGEKRTDEIREAVGMSKSSVKKALKILREEGAVIQVKRGLYKLAKRPALRTEDQNADTIDQLLNLYDTALNKYAVLIKEMLDSKQTLEEKAKFLNNFKLFASMVDILMKRWYLVHRGYDSNSRQAYEDALANARKAEKEELANAPLEERIAEVAHYDPIMKEIWDNLPKEEPEKKKV